MKLNYRQNRTSHRLPSVILIYPMTALHGNIKPRSLRASRLHRRQGQYGRWHWIVDLHITCSLSQYCFKRKTIDKWFTDSHWIKCFHILFQVVMSRIYVSMQGIICSIGGCPASNNAGTLSMGQLIANLSKILISIHQFSVKKINDHGDHIHATLFILNRIVTGAWYTGMTSVASPYARDSCHGICLDINWPVKM